MWEEIGTEYRAVSYETGESEVFRFKSEADECADSLKAHGRTDVAVETRTLYKTSTIDYIDWK